MTTALRVAALTGGQNVPSARFRVRALVADLRRTGIKLEEYAPMVSKYPPRSKWLRPFWMPAAFTARLPGVALSHAHDLTLLQRELISTLYTIEGLTKKPRVLDVDDAIFLRRDGRAAKRLAQACDLVICGNDFLADWFSQFNPNIELLPTSIDCRRFRPAAASSDVPPTASAARQNTVIGWTGTSTNLGYLTGIEPALARVLKARPTTRLRIVCDRPPHLPQLPQAQINYVPWRADIEVQVCQQFDIGIMPLEDGDWERGKCAFKLLQYMACAKPVVASPVGVNAELLADERVGISAGSNVQWEEALIQLIDEPRLRQQFGSAGRHRAETDYDTPMIADRMSNYLKRLARPATDNK